MSGAQDCNVPVRFVNLIDLFFATGIWVEDFESIPVLNAIDTQVFTVFTKVIFTRLLRALRFIAAPKQEYTSKKKQLNKTLKHLESHQIAHRLYNLEKPVACAHEDYCICVKTAD